MKDNDDITMASSTTDTATPCNGKGMPVKVTEWRERRQAGRRSDTERRDPHGVRAGNPDRRNPDRRRAERRESGEGTGDKE